MPHDIFISYRRDGGEHLAGRIKDALKVRGLSVFMDVEDLKSGKFDTALLREIEQATDVIVILTPGCLDRCMNEDDWFRQEIRHAIKCERNVVPIIARGFQMPPSVSLPSDIAELVMFSGLTPAPEMFEASIDRLISTFLISNGQLAEGIRKSEPVLLGKGTESPGIPATPSLSDLRKAVETSPSARERARAIQMIGLRGGQSEIPWLTDLVFRSKRKATWAAAIKQISLLGSHEAIRSLKSIAENHTSDLVRMEAVELIPQLDHISDPEWLLNFLRCESEYCVKYSLLEALAKEAWSNRLDMGSNGVRSFINELQRRVDAEGHPDVRHYLVSIVAHLCRDEPWTREWVLQKANQAEQGYYRTRGYAIGLSVWNDDREFIGELENCPKEFSDEIGKMFVQWAKEGDWKRYRFHMGGWGPKE